MSASVAPDPPAEIASTAMTRRIEAFSPVNHLQAEVNQTLKQALLREELRGSDLIEELGEDLPVSLLSRPEILSSSSLFRNIRDLLITREVPNLNYGRGFPIVPSVFRCLYQGNDTDIERAIHSFSRFSSAQYERPEENPPPIHHTPPRLQNYDHGSEIVGVEEKRANSIAARFKDRSRTFSGRLDENLEVKLRNYEEAATENKLSAEQRSQLIYHMLSGEAQDFFFDNIKSCHVSYADRKAALEKEYCSSARQGRARAHLRTARVTAYISEAQGDMLKGITSLYEDINRYAPQCPPDSRTDLAKRRFLEDAITGYTWSRDAVSRAESKDNPEHTFNGLYQASCASIQQEIKAAKAVMADTAMNALPTHLNADQTKIQHTRAPPALVMYGQRYATPKTLAKQSPKHSSSSPFKRAKTCWKCGEEGHFVATCPRKDLSLTDVVKGRLRSTTDENRSATRVLFELVTSLDGAADTDDEEIEEESRTYFDELIAEHQSDPSFR
jgi:hypothetical protein